MKIKIYLTILFLLLSLKVYANVRSVQDNFKAVYNVIDTSGNHVSSETITLAIQRASDGYWYDFNDSTFKNSGWTNKTVNLTEDSTNGLYAYTFNPPASETDAEQYVMLYDNASATYGDHQSELVSYQDLAGSSASGIADAVLDELLSGHTTSGSLSATLTNITNATDGDKESGSYTGIENTIRRSR